MHHARKHTMSQIRKPFSTVVDLQFHDCDLAQPLINLKKWFPRIRLLKFHGSNKIANRESIQNIKSSSIIRTKKYQHQKNTNDFRMFVTNAISSISCSSELRISDDGWNLKFLRCFFWQSHKFRYLHIEWKRNFSRNQTERMKDLKMGRFKNVEELWIDFGNNKNVPIVIPFSFDRLKRIHVHGKCGKMNDTFLKSIKNQPNLTYVNEDLKCYVTDEIKKKIPLAGALRKSHKIQLPYVCIVMRYRKLNSS